MYSQWSVAFQKEAGYRSKTAKACRTSESTGPPTSQLGRWKNNKILSFSSERTREVAWVLLLSLSNMRSSNTRVRIGRLRTDYAVVRSWPFRPTQISGARLIHYHFLAMEQHAVIGQGDRYYDGQMWPYNVLAERVAHILACPIRCGRYGRFVLPHHVAAPCVANIDSRPTT